MAGLSRRFTLPLPWTWLAALVAAAVIVAGLGAVCVSARHGTGTQHADGHVAAGGAVHDSGAGTGLQSGFMQSGDVPSRGPGKCCKERQPEAFGETPAHQRAGTDGPSTPPLSASPVSPRRTLHSPGRHRDARVAVPTPGDLSISRT
ncbi:hypothetical protein AHIS1636_40260 [Arthrobacter mangrovi]|uniref:Uncharacterized protein n=1 Tax=Arthrobacter mangrovi TaxID=2966350 RepID=A0ABQ5N088_9MICC|nr:hypothetical protein AHIS1636_40260 [Arthrobacter mangrovi]